MIKLVLTTAFYISIVIAGFSLGASPIWAQQATNSALPSITTQPTFVPSPEVTNVQPTQTTGEVVRRENNVLTVKTGNEVKQISIPDNVKVTRNTFGGNIADIKPNDEVTITEANGMVLSVEATSGKLFDFGKWLIPMLVLGLIAVLALWFILKRANKSHIKTTME
jgi:hypothetical protein